MTQAYYEAVIDVVASFWAGRLALCGNLAG